MIYIRSLDTLSRYGDGVLGDSRDAIAPSDIANDLTSTFGVVKTQREIYKDRLGIESLLSASEWTAAGGSMDWFEQEAMKIRDMANSLIPIFGSDYTINFDGYERDLTHLSKYGVALLGYENGGYTGDSMGVIHPNEYVLNAETSSKIGLNDSSSTGVFGEIAKQNKEMVEEIKLLRKDITYLKQIESNTRPSRIASWNL